MANKKSGEQNAAPLETHMKRVDLAAKQPKATSGRERQSGNHSRPVWGVGPDGRVYHWTGTSWSEPNAVARLNQIAASTYGGAWGLGAGGRVFLTLDGTSWTEPDPTRRLQHISGNRHDAWGINESHRILRSFNEGQYWSELAFVGSMKQVSAGNPENVWGLTTDGHVRKYNASTQAWDEPNAAARLNQISAMANDGAWGLGNGQRVFFSIDGASWSEPNPGAGLNQIAAADDLLAWGIGNGNRVFQTENRGTVWSEPNPQARLKYVSI